MTPPPQPPEPPPAALFEASIAAASSSMDMDAAEAARHPHSSSPASKPLQGERVGPERSPLFLDLGSFTCVPSWLVYGCVCVGTSQNVTVDGD